MVLVLADAPALRLRLPDSLQKAGFRVRVGHGISEAVEIASADPPRAVVLDLLHGTEDAWRQLRRVVGDARLIVAGTFTPHAVAERLQAFAYVPNGDVEAIVASLTTPS
ncbi:MAG: hypothetical protein JOZ17_10620 [Acetobacteraceae bacterium]|nr:hypothetical protein [Acetobacteraceae bacterium]